MLWKKHALYKNWTLQEVRDELDAVEQFDQQGKRPHYVIKGRDCGELFLTFV
jgi:hypothetical protein